MIAFSWMILSSIFNQSEAFDNQDKNLNNSIKKCQEKSICQLHIEYLQQMQAILLSVVCMKYLQYCYQSNPASQLQFKIWHGHF